MICVYANLFTYGLFPLQAIGSSFSLVTGLPYSSRPGMNGCPKFGSHLQGIDLAPKPPRPLVACAMNFVMVDRAQRDGEFIAHLETQGAILGVPDMMRV